MANTASAKKQARASAKRTVRNRSVRSAVKTRVVRVRRAVAEGTTEGLVELVATAVSSLDRAASKGILHRNNAGRRKSRLMRKLNSVEAAPAEGAAPASRSGGGKSAGAQRGKSAGAQRGKGSPAKAAAKPAARGDQAKPGRSTKPAAAKKK